LSTSQVEALRLRGTPYKRRVELQFNRTDDLQILGQRHDRAGDHMFPASGPSADVTASPERACLSESSSSKE
jgi:hypothetical protein